MLDVASVAGQQNINEVCLSETHAAAIGDEKVVFGKLFEADDEVDPDPSFEALGNPSRSTSKCRRQRFTNREVLSLIDVMYIVRFDYLVA